MLFNTGVLLLIGFPRGQCNSVMTAMQLNMDVTPLRVFNKVCTHEVSSSEAHELCQTLSFLCVHCYMLGGAIMHLLNESRITRSKTHLDDAETSDPDEK